jgi:hypothetical protein
MYKINFDPLRRLWQIIISLFIICSIIGCSKGSSQSIKTLLSEHLATSSSTHTYRLSSTPTTKKHQTPTQTTTITNTSSPTRSFQIANPAASITYPPNIEKLSKVTGMETWEIKAVYSIIHDAITTNNPTILSQLIHYPMIGCGRCGGLTLKTPEDFIKTYPVLMDGKTRQALARERLEDLAGNYQGVMLGGGKIWFSAYCNDESCQAHTIYIVKFLDQCQYWFQQDEMSNLAVDSSNFSFGMYIVDPNYLQYITMLDQSEIDAIKRVNIEILPTSYKVTPPNGWFGKTCPTATMEFCPKSDSKYSDISAVGMLNIICGNDLEFNFDIISKSRIVNYIMGTDKVYLYKEN